MCGEGRGDVVCKDEGKIISVTYSEGGCVGGGTVHKVAVIHLCMLYRCSKTHAKTLHYICDVCKPLWLTCIVFGWKFLTAFLSASYVCNG